MPEIEQAHEHEVDETTAMWKFILENGHRDSPSSYLPGSPRCRMCLIPIGGIGGMLMKATRRRIPSRKNPNVCNY
jgi:hypothetical protein